MKLSKEQLIEVAGYKAEIPHGKHPLIAKMANVSVATLSRTLNGHAYNEAVIAAIIQFFINQKAERVKRFEAII